MLPSIRINDQVFTTIHYPPTTGVTAKIDKMVKRPQLGICLKMSVTDVNVEKASTDNNVCNAGQTESCKVLRPLVLILSFYHSVVQPDISKSCCCDAFVVIILFFLSHKPIEKLKVLAIAATCSGSLVRQKECDLFIRAPPTQMVFLTQVSHLSMCRQKE